MLTIVCFERLINFKFKDAVGELTDDATDDERELVHALAIFGNPGWFLGGEMETIINAAIRTVAVETP